MHFLRYVLIAFAVVAAGTEFSRADELKADQDLNKLLEGVRKKYDLPALAGAVISSKGVQRIGAVGVRKRGEDVAVTINDRFHIGSDTKAMTATLIARLVEDGKLSYELTLGKSFPELAKTMSPEVAGVTLKHLLTHRSGLPANPKRGWWQFHDRRSTLKQRLDVVKLALPKKLEHKPGEKFQYSNMGYVIAAAMAERAAEQSWDSMIRKMLFAPLKMKSAGFGPPGSPEKIEEPWPHSAEGKPVRPVRSNDNPPLIGPAGRVHCSLPDWAKFLSDQLKGAAGQRGLLKPATYKMLHADTMGRGTYTIGGWGLSRTRRGITLVHDGTNTTNYATAWMMPQIDVAIVVVCNQGGPAAKKACREAAMTLYRQQKPIR